MSASLLVFANICARDSSSKSPPAELLWSFKCFSLISPPVAAFEDAMLAKCMISLVILVIVRVKVIVTAIVTVIEIEKSDQLL